MKNKKMVFLAFGIFVLVILTMAFYALGASGNGLELSENLLIITVLILVALSFVILADNFRNARAGLPIKDEREKRIWHKASYYAYLFSIYFALGISWMSDIIAEFMGLPELTVGQAIGFIIIGPSIVFILLYLYFRRTGKTE
jgi:uncharacterized membrane protein